jgi:HD-like signal output (HDOD) protein
MDSAASLPAWAAGLAWRDLPVLRATADAVHQLASHADDADAHTLAGTVLADPLMGLRVLAGATARQSRLATPVETVTAALVLTGIDPFFRDCATLPVLEDRLAGASRAEALAVVERSHLAARIAAAFAIHRQDEDVEEVHLAALLHDFPAVLACYFAGSAQALPGPAGAIADALLQRWGLPETLRTLAREPAGSAAGPRTVAIAVRIATHVQRGGWHAPELAADCVDAGHLLNLQPHAAMVLAREAAG